MLDEQLRDELGCWADGSARLRVPEVGVLRRRARRRRARLTVTCAGLAATAVAVAVSLPAVLQQAGRPAGHRTGWRPAGPPLPPDAGIGAAPYFVTLLQQDHAPAVVTNALTGKMVTVVRPPAAAGLDGFEWVSAAADDRTFVLAGQRPTGALVHFYELQLGGGGRPLPLRPLALPVRTGDLLFALSPDGSRLAVAADGQTAIEVITLATGRHRLWRPAGHRQVTGLAWVGQHQLAVTWFRVASALANRVGPSGGLGLLPVGAPGGSLAQIRLLIGVRVAFGRFHGLVNPLVSADGSVIYGTMTSNGPERHAEVVEFSGRTGRPLRAASPAVGESGMGQWCGAVWVDQAGAQAAVVCGDSLAAQGVTSDGRFRARDLHLPVPKESVPTAVFIGW